jgi:hypothetical protein
MTINLKKDKRFLELNIQRCRELFDTGILFDGTKNPFIQSVFIELMARLRHLDHVLNLDSTDDPILIKLRDAGVHPYLNRESGDGSFIIDFARRFMGNWQYDGGDFKKIDDSCEVFFQYGDSEISAKELLKLIEVFENKIKVYEE